MEMEVEAKKSSISCGSNSSWTVLQQEEESAEFEEWNDSASLELGEKTRSDSSLIVCGEDSKDCIEVNLNEMLQAATTAELGSGAETVNFNSNEDRIELLSLLMLSGAILIVVVVSLLAVLASPGSVRTVRLQKPGVCFRAVPGFPDFLQEKEKVKIINAVNNMIKIVNASKVLKDFKNFKRSSLYRTWKAPEGKTEKIIFRKYIRKIEPQVALLKKSEDLALFPNQSFFILAAHVVQDICLLKVLKHFNRRISPKKIIKSRFLLKKKGREIVRNKVKKSKDKNEFCSLEACNQTEVSNSKVIGALMAELEDVNNKWSFICEKQKKEIMMLRRFIEESLRKKQELKQLSPKTIEKRRKIKAKIDVLTDQLESLEIRRKVFLEKLAVLSKPSKVEWCDAPGELALLPASSHIFKPKKNKTFSKITSTKRTSKFSNRSVQSLTPSQSDSGIIAKRKSHKTVGEEITKSIVYAITRRIISGRQNSSLESNETSTHALRESLIGNNEGVELKVENKKGV